MITDFGTTPAGQTVRQIVLQYASLRVAILTYGCALQSLRLAGVAHDLTLGSHDLADYLGPMCYHGTLIGPVANRLTGAQAMVEGRKLHLVPNEGENLLHAGAHGMQARVWDILACSETAVTLGLMLRDGEDGFPGQRVVMARFSLTGAALRLDVQATTDAPTLMNIAQHSYWNLNGTPDWAGHVLQLAATHVLPTNAAGLPTGQIEAVDGTALDFRKARGIAPGNPVMDVNFCVAQTRQPLRDVLWLSGHAVQMTFATTEPGVQVYDGAAGIRPGHGPYEGLAIEAQGWPDAPQHAHFPAITLLPQDRYHQTTVWQFAAL